MMEETDEWGTWEVKAQPSGAKVRVLKIPSSEFELNKPLFIKVKGVDLNKLKSVLKTKGIITADSEVE